MMASRIWDFDMKRSALTNILALLPATAGQAQERVDNSAVASGAAASRGDRVVYSAVGIRIIKAGTFRTRKERQPVRLAGPPSRVVSAASAVINHSVIATIDLRALAVSSDDCSASRRPSS